MKQALLVGVMAGAVLSLSAAALAAEGTFERTLKVSGPVLLGVDTNSGNVHVSPGPVDAVHIVARVRSDNSGGWFGKKSSGSDEERVHQVVSNPPINQTGNIISVGHNFHVEHVSIDYEITTPRGTDLRVDSGSGDVRVEDNGGPAQLKSGSGNVEASGLSDHVQLETGSGSITATMLSARDVKAQTGSGDIKLKNVQSGLWAETGSGTINVSGKPTSAWKLETGSGDISADTGGAALSLNATTGSGDLAYQGSDFKQTGGNGKDHLAGDVHGGGPIVRANTGSGNIHLK